MRKNNRLPPPPPVSHSAVAVETEEQAVLSVVGPPPVVSFDALRDAVLNLDDESKRDMLQAILETMDVSEEHTGDDAADVVKDTTETWRAAEPEVYAVGIVARAVSGTLKVGNIHMDLLEYLAGRTPAQQSQIKNRLRITLGTASMMANEAVARL